MPAHVWVGGDEAGMGVCACGYTKGKGKYVLDG